MKYQYQTRPHPNGDCMRACLATILEYPIANIPDFTLLEDEPGFDPKKDYPKWYLALQDFVRQFGLVFVEIVLDKRPWMPLPAEMLCIFMGEHVNGQCKHAIVGKCVDGGFYPIFDPIGEEVHDITLKEVESIGLLVPTDPMNFMRMGQALEEVKLTSRGVTNRIVGDAIESACDTGLGLKRPDAPRIYSPSGQLIGTKDKPAEGIIVPG